MNQRQLELIPTGVLHDTKQLLGWLDARGWRMTLLELDAERRRRKEATHHRHAHNQRTAR